MMLTITSLVLDSGVLPAGNGAFPYFVAVQNGFASALCTCLLINGFVGFQLYEDGTSQSVWLLRGSSFAMFIISFAVSILTFVGKLGLSPTNTLGLFVVLYLLNGICILIYVVMQIILVVGTLQDRWPLGDIIFGVLFFVAGQVVLYVFSDKICVGAQHYLDGLFITTITNLLAVMMVYKVCEQLFCPDFCAPVAPLPLRPIANPLAVLGLYNQGGPRVQCRYKTEQLGSQRAASARRRSFATGLPGCAV
jgi:hypothetical protein